MIRILEAMLILGAVTTNITLAIIIYLRKRSAITNILFSVVAVWFGVWGLCLFFYGHPFFLTSLFWLRGAYISATCLEIFIVAFSFNFPKPTLRKVWSFIALYSVLFFAMTIYLLLFTKMWIVQVAWIQGTVSTQLGPSYLYWVAGEWVLILVSVWALFTNYAKARGLIKTQLQYLLIGFFLFGILVNIPDVIIPITFHSTQFFGISSVLSLIFTGTIAYIIIKHRFFDLSRAMHHFAYYILAITSLGVLYCGIIFLLGLIFFPHEFFPLYTIASVFCILLFRYITTPLRDIISKRAKRIFSGGLYEREDVLRKLNDVSIHTTNLQVMVDETLQILYHAFAPEFCIGLSLLDGVVGVLKSYDPHQHKRHTLSKEDIQAVSTLTNITVTDELPNGPLKACLKKLAIAVVLPFHGEKWQRFVLLGQKQSGESYYNYDIDTCTFIQPMLRLMGQHVRQVEMIRQFNRRLEKEVAVATKEVRLVNTRLRKADTLKDEFISIASHELKTPTTAIQGFLWLVLQKDKNLSAYSKDKLERVAKLTGQITTLVNDMLDVSKIESKKIALHPEVFGIRYLIEEVKGEFDLFAIQKHIAVTITGGVNYQVFADRQRVHQVMSNLLSNALKYTKENGRIKIRVEKKDGQIVVHTTDTGIGIRKEDMPKLFTKFGKLDDGNSVSSHLPGTGLGLYITKHLVELSGGTIWVESTYHKGSTFSFSLPGQKEQ